MEVDFERKTFRVEEFCLGFIQISQKDAESLVEDILMQLEEDEIEVLGVLGGQSQWWCSCDSWTQKWRSSRNIWVCKKKEKKIMSNCEITRSLWWVYY